MLINRKIIFILISTALYTSCSLVGGIDGIKPSYQLDPENLIQDAESAETALRGVYESWRSAGITQNLDAFGVMAGSLVYTSPPANGNQWLNNSVTADNSSTASMYVNYYKIINAANNIIPLLDNKDIPKLDEQRKTEIIAECKIHRALAHFNLLRLFGQFFDQSSSYGIVLRDQPFDELSACKRSSVRESYAFIIADLDYGITHASKRNDKHYYMTAILAKALKAKIMLYESKFEEAKDLAKEVIDSAGNYGYELTSSYDGIFNDGHDSKEALFCLYSYGYSESASTLFRYTNFSSYLKTISDLLPDNQNNGNLNEGSGYDKRFTYVYSLDTKGPSSNGKYPFKINATDKRNSIFLLRLAEIYLIYTEATVRTHDFQSARTSLSAITSRAGYSSDYVSTISDHDLLSYLFQHKWIELFSEYGEEWFDLIRFYKAGDIDGKSIKPTIVSENQFCFPIPQTALAGNNLLIQNPQ
ncbi:SusD family protein [bacterium A37T11]|nr:SusD family protein [bacterium A37T11]